MLATDALGAGGSLQSFLLGGVRIAVASDCRIPILESDSFAPFSTPPGQSPPPELSVRFKGLDDSSLSMPLPGADERRAILGTCVSRRMGLGVQTFYPEARWVGGRPDSPPLEPVADPLEVPPLRSPEVRARIAECLDHPADVFLLLHAATVEIRDFRERRADVFYLSRLSNDDSLLRGARRVAHRAVRGAGRRRQVDGAGAEQGRLEAQR